MIIVIAVIILVAEWSSYICFIAQQKRKRKESNEIKKWIISLAKYSNTSESIGSIISESAMILDDYAMQTEILKAANQLNYGEYPIIAFQTLLEKYNYQVLREIIAHMNTTYYYSGDYQRLFRAIESDYMLESNISYRIEKSKHFDVIIQQMLIMCFPIIFMTFLLTSQGIYDYYFSSGEYLWLAIVMVIYSYMINQFINSSKEDIYD